MNFIKVVSDINKNFFENLHFIEISKMYLQFDIKK